MSSINIETLLTIVYVHVDDWYQAKASELLSDKVGCKPVFSDSEVMTLMIAEEYIPCELLKELGIGQASNYLMDTKPIPVVGYKRSKRHSDFAGSADYGQCSSRNLFYFGYKLGMVTTLDGIPVVYDLVSANTDERQAVETVLDRMQNAQIIGDKGFIGAEWQTQIAQQTSNTIVTPKRKNQMIQHPDGFEQLLNTVREWIEGVFHELQNTGRNMERWLAKTVVGLTTRVIAKVTAHLFRHILRLRYHIDIQTFHCQYLRQNSI